MLKKLLHAAIFTFTLVGLSAVASSSQAPGSSAPASQPSRVTPSQSAQQSPEEKLQTARDLAAHGRLEQALTLLNDLSGVTPEPAGVERLRGMIFYQTDRLAEAVDAFAKATGQDAQDTESMEMQGVSLFRLGRPMEAIPLLEKGSAQVVNANVDPQYVLALCYADARRFDDARHAFAAQFGFAPDSAEAYLLEGRMLLRRDLTEQATISAEAAIKIDAKIPLAHELLGEIALAKSDLATAVTEFEAEKKINPMDAATHERLGDAQIRSGNYEAARVELNRAVLLEPNSTAPFILLGEVFLKMKQPIQALHYLAHAEKMDPSNFVTHNLLGQAYKATGQLAEANREFKRVAELKKTDDQTTTGK